MYDGVDLLKNGWSSKTSPYKSTLNDTIQVEYFHKWCTDAMGRWYTMNISRIINGQDLGGTQVCTSREPEYNKIYCSMTC